MAWLDRMVEPGQVVGGTGTLFRIAEHGDMEMRASCPKPIWRIWRWVRGEAAGGTTRPSSAMCGSSRP
jgi:hypothetical protein